MIEVKRSFDYDLLSTIANLPENYRVSADDFSPPMGQYRVTGSDRIVYLLAFESDGQNDSVLGFGAFIPLNAVCFDSHICFMPSAYGRTADCCIAMFDWIWKRTDCRKITGSIARFNRLAISLARRCGMKIEGINFASFMKNGKLHDQVYLGISKCL